MGTQDLAKIAIHPMHESLRFRIAEPNIEFQNLRARSRHHQARVEKSAEVESRDRRFDDCPHDHGRLLGRENPAVAISAHAPGVGSCIAVEDRLVILGGFERDHVFAVAERDEADFFADEKFFDHEPRTQRIHRSDGLFASGGDDHTFACGESVGFDDDGQVELIERLDGDRTVIRSHEAGSGDADVLHELL